MVSYVLYAVEPSDGVVSAYVVVVYLSTYFCVGFVALVFVYFVGDKGEDDDAEYGGEYDCESE